MNQKSVITIVGAGPVGCYLAILLAQRGYKVDIYERFSEEEICKYSTSRSFSITFFKRGVDLLGKAGILADFTPHLLAIEGSSIHPPYAPEILLDADSTKTPYYVVKRSAIVDVMMKEVAKNPSIKIHFSTALISVDRYNQTLLIQDLKTKEFKTIPFSVLLGADGAHSQVRKYVYEGQDAVFSEEHEQWKYKQVYFSPEEVAKMHLKKTRMHLWPREKSMMLVFPDADGSMTGMMVAASYEDLKTKADAQAFIKENYPQLTANIEQLSESILKNPEGKFVSIHVNPWFYKGCIALLGDSAHAALPSHGQGITAGFEDAWTLIQLLDEHGPDWQTIFPVYQDARKKHADVLVDVSQKSFSKFLRHKKADYEAIYDRADDLLHRFFPSLWHPPFYVMMSSYKEGFADILALHKKQRRLAAFLGLSAAVWLLTKTLGITEDIAVFFKKNLK